jgi:hypothetical protein
MIHVIIGIKLKAFSGKSEKLTDASEIRIALKYLKINLAKS